MASQINQLYPLVIDKKPTAVNQKCQICKGQLDKGDLRLFVKFQEYRRTKTFYFHIHCFLGKLIAKLQVEGYDTTQFIAGSLFL